MTSKWAINWGLSTDQKMIGYDSMIGQLDEYETRCFLLVGRINGSRGEGFISFWEDSMMVNPATILHEQIFHSQVFESKYIDVLCVGGWSVGYWLGGYVVVESCTLIITYEYLWHEVLKGAGYRVYLPLLYFLPWLPIYPVFFVCYGIHVVCFP